MKLGGVSSNTEGQTWEDLPRRLKALISRSLALQEKIVRLDAALRRPVEAGSNPVARELDRLADAFGGQK